MLHIHENQSQIICYMSIFMIMMVYSQKLIPAVHCSVAYLTCSKTISISMYVSATFDFKLFLKKIYEPYLSPIFLLIQIKLV